MPNGNKLYGEKQNKGKEYLTLKFKQSCRDPSLKGWHINQGRSGRDEEVSQAEIWGKIIPNRKKQQLWRPWGQNTPDVVKEEQGARMPKGE